MKILVVEPGKHPYEKEIEGTLKEMQEIVGTFFLCGLGLEDFTSLPENLMEKYRKRFYSPQIYTTSGVYNIPPERYRLLMEKLGESV